MEIVILQGSPNKKGSTNILVENFSQGAKAAGHSVRRFDLADMDIRPCTGCVTCGYEGPCILHDDNQKIRKAVLDADSDNWTFDELESHYRTLVRYLNLQDQGMVLGRGCGTPSMTKHSQYPEMAYKLGNRL